ncbi:hypothetical protein RDWZM_007265 [Blomia tropicalis]|uniref:Cadherin domain-containing protein n=1 Tax=Blomia tropicalis TaxID=40697 RepID=A0A9Q0RMJ3_BLOTA|nr:hypothetical protein RDWZM_007265 [Blomia tropicalis]
MTDSLVENCRGNNDDDHHQEVTDSFYFELKENSPSQTYIGKIATKPGFTYRFNDDPVEFHLDPSTGVITTTDVAVDRESKDSYNLVILSSSPTYPIEVRIRIIDVNDNAPWWPATIQTNVSFSESAPVGTKVIIDNAIDLDSGLLSYSIDPVNDGSLYSSVLPFKLNFNSSTSFLHLEVCSKLDRELQSNYLVNITAIDEDQHSSFAIFNIRILDSNDNPPIFDHSDYSVSLNESTGKDVTILQVRATDADEDENDNSRISYYLGVDNEDFLIDSGTGSISIAHDGPIRCGTTTEKLMNENWRICVFTVFAHDHGVPRQDGRTYVTAKIYDTNNHAPIIKFRFFSKSNIVASVDENAANGSVAAAASVLDYDQGPNGQTTIEIADGNQLTHFRLESFGNSHIIRVNGILDREKVPKYNLTIRAYDHGVPSRSTTANLIIVVQDTNDHAPTFSERLYETSITENENQIGMFVYALQATDLDEGINSQVYYSLSGSNSHYFKIDATSGLITTDQLIDREEIDLFELRVTARDGGSNPKWANTTLKVKILDVNDQIPIIELSPKYQSNNPRMFNVQVQNDQILDLDLIVKDNDLGNNGTVTVNILYDYERLFRFDHETMKLISTQSLTIDNHCSFYQLMVEARDQAPEVNLEKRDYIRDNITRPLKSTMIL